jgi:hypothetical protein
VILIQNGYRFFNYFNSSAGYLHHTSQSTYRLQKNPLQPQKPACINAAAVWCTHLCMSDMWVHSVVMSCVHVMNGAFWQTNIVHHNTVEQRFVDYQMVTLKNGYSCVH